MNTAVVKSKEQVADELRAIQSKLLVLLAQASKIITETPHITGVDFKRATEWLSNARISLTCAHDLAGTSIGLDDTIYCLEGDIDEMPYDEDCHGRRLDQSALEFN